jgi:uncharacterized protein YecE (DUF72 family)
MVDYYIGTMGFSYRDWSGVFYPSGVSPKDYLSLYSRIFNAVEIDSTFYGIPRMSSVAHWGDQSPSGFKFCLKLPRSITHEAKLVDVQDELASFVKSACHLGDKLGVILIQFPPSFDAANQVVFEQFLKDLPEEQAFAVEFRHPSWYAPKTTQLLADHEVCWVASEYPGVPREVELTTGMMFIRLVGVHGRFRAHNREQIDISAQLSSWWQWIRLNVDNVHTVYVFFNDDYAGYAPGSANRLKRLIGLPVVKPQIPKQLRFI